MAQRSRSGAGNGQLALELEKDLALLYFVARRAYAIDLTHRAIRVLQLVAFSVEPPRIDDVARYLGCATSTASELVKRLQAKGLVVRRRSGQDERVVHLALTDVGQTALTEHTSLDPQKLESGLRSLSASDRRELVRLVSALTDAVGAEPIG